MNLITAARIYYDTVMLEKSDPRVADWPLMASPWPMLTLTALYLYLVWQGPKWMADRKPFDLKSVLIVYNLSLVALSAYMFWEFFASSILNPNFSVFCEAVDYGDGLYATRLAKVIWWYYISKIIEFMDTFFFILRKKNSQISFLHVYHHSTMVVLWYIGTKFVAGGESYFSAMINSFIHILMYSYYGLSACGPAMQKFLWWKKYMTSLQLLQFVVVIVHSAIGIYHSCGYPVEWLIFLMAYLTSHVVLFGNFYRQAYTVGKKNGRVAAKCHKGESEGRNGFVQESEIQLCRNGEVTFKDGTNGMVGKVVHRHNTAADQEDVPRNLPQ